MAKKKTKKAPAVKKIVPIRYLGSSESAYMPFNGSVRRVSPGQVVDVSVDVAESVVSSSTLWEYA